MNIKFLISWCLIFISSATCSIAQETIQNSRLVTTNKAPFNISDIRYPELYNFESPQEEVHPTNTYQPEDTVEQTQTMPFPLYSSSDENIQPTYCGPIPSCPPFEHTFFSRTKENSKRTYHSFKTNILRPTGSATLKTLRALARATKVIARSTGSGIKWTYERRGKIAAFILAIYRSFTKRSNSSYSHCHNACPFHT